MKTKGMDMNIFDSVMIVVLLLNITGISWMSNVFNILKPFYLILNILVILLLSTVPLMQKYLTYKDMKLTEKDKYEIMNKGIKYYVHRLIDVVSFVLFAYTNNNFLAGVIVSRAIIVYIVGRIIISKLEEV